MENKEKKEKNPAAMALGKLGGLVVSDAKKHASRLRALKYWAKKREEKALEEKALINNS